MLLKNIVSIKGIQKNVLYDAFILKIWNRLDFLSFITKFEKEFERLEVNNIYTLYIDIYPTRINFSSSQGNLTMDFIPGKTDRNFIVVREYIMNLVKYLYLRSSITSF